MRRLLSAALLLGALVVPAAAGTTDPCPVVADPTARCGEVVGHGSDFVNDGNLVRAGDRLVLVSRDQQWRYVNVIAYDSRTMRRLYARTTAAPGRVRLYTTAYAEGTVVVAGWTDRESADGTRTFAAYVAAFAVRDGRQLWSHVGRYDVANESEAVVAVGGRAYLAETATGANGTYRWAVSAYDLRTGRRAWRVVDDRDLPSGWPRAMVRVGDRLLVVGSGGSTWCGQPRRDVLSLGGARLSTEVDTSAACGAYEAVTTGAKGSVVLAGWQGADSTAAGSGVVVALDPLLAKVRWALQGSALLGRDAVHVAAARGRVLVASQGFVSWPAVLPVKVVSLDEATGGVVWEQALGPGTRSGVVHDLQVSDDGRLLYLTGREGTPFIDVTVADRADHLGSGELFVRALDAGTGAEVWSGRRPPDTNELGLSMSDGSSVRQVGDRVVVAGTSAWSEWSSGSTQRSIQLGLLLSFPAR